jgi:hypothetical protein
MHNTQSKKQKDQKQKPNPEIQTFESNLRKIMIVYVWMERVNMICITLKGFRNPPFFFF